MMQVKRKFSCIVFIYKMIFGIRTCYLVYSSDISVDGMSFELDNPQTCTVTESKVGVIYSG